MNAISGLFGGRPKRPYTGTGRVPQVTKQDAQITRDDLLRRLARMITRDDLLRRLARMRRATMTSELTTPNIKRKTLGAA
ncbi:MAG: hypothetical protein ACYTBZ_31540 [Planctomycetota bacterium]|jgi:hypothetical protein